MKLTILISTLASRVYGLKSVLDSVDIACYTIIIVQGHCDGDIKKYLQSLSKSYGSRILYSNTVGVTSSRNIGINSCTTPYALFCDDDIQYVPGSLAKVISSFEENPDAAFLTYNVIDENGINLKQYPQTVIRHSKFSIMKVGTIEVAVNMDICRGVNFPEDMGAGKKLYCCDEPVYLSNIINKLKDKKNAGYHVPLTLCIHPRISSGKSLKSRYALLTRWICFKRVYPFYQAPIVFIAFCVKNFRKIFL
ncbi:glycosyltransferase family 2 protein [Pseudocitrobacter cyperus]|uniref:Glycosyltransferase family 2 protein n=1 Tax=Pseudocitrobacter cyperus TaxID=3112843 RepID=A0ABV0HLM3_9ENTR